MLKKILILLFGNVKLLFLKISHPKKLKYSLYNNISITNEIELKNGGRIILGKKVIIKKNCRISANKGIIEIGNRSGFNNNCYVVSHEHIKIGDNVEIGPNCVIVDHDHDYKKEFAENGLNRYYKIDKIEIGNNVWIGANSVILRGTKIGNNCVIGAGSIVKGVYKDNSIIIQKKQRM